MSIKGAWAASLTPVTEDHQPDYGGLAQWTGSLLARGLDGVVIFGTTGEATSFSIDQRRKGLEAVRRTLEPERVMVGVGTTALADTIELIHHAGGTGVAAALVLPPFYYQLDDAGVLGYYRELVSRTADLGVPLMLYNIPQVSGVKISAEVAGKLFADFPETIIGVKDSSGDEGSLLAFIEAMPDGVVMAGNETLLPACVAAGGAGTISGPANLWAAPVAALAADPADPAKLEAMVTVRSHLSRYPAVPALKALAARWTGNRSLGRPAPPLRSLTETQDDELASALAASGSRGLV